jgi:hypothetical protein
MPSWIGVGVAIPFVGFVVVVEALVVVGTVPMRDTQT